MDIEVVRRICLARHYLELAESYLKSPSDLYLFSAANLLQDGVEVFLLAICDAVGVSMDTRNTFDKYFVLINGKLAPKELPFKTQLLRLNRIRVDSKHFGIQPDRSEIERLSVSVKEFFRETCESVLGENFSTLSVIDLLNEGQTKESLLRAKTALESGALDECAIECRKAIYLELEYRYSIYQFRDGAKPRGLLSAMSSAPSYSRNADYIKKNVKTPTDYICIDHGDIDRKLATMSVDHTSFWNIWRLTPKVFKDDQDRWFIEHDFQKLDMNVLADNIQYIFDATTDMALSIHSNKNRTRTSPFQRFHLKLAREETPIYEKADRNSTAIGVTPKGETHIDCGSRSAGLQDEGPYWAVSYVGEGVFLHGFVHNDDLQDSEEVSDMQTGTVKWFDLGRGFGFIVGDDGIEAFLHKSKIITDDLEKLEGKRRVQYRTEPAEKGPVALDVKCID